MAQVRVDEKDSAALKQWLIKRLENISDADPDVLADYALVLIKTDEPDDVLRTSCVEGLQDFLHDNTEPFVQDVLKVLRTKEYIPGHKSKQQRHANQALQSEQGKGANGQSKKRAFSDRKSPEAGGQFSTRPTQYERPQKQLRRGGNNRGDFGGRGNRGNKNDRGGFPPNHLPMYQNMYGMPPSAAQGFPSFDSNDPVAAMLAMQAMGFQPPHFANFSGQGSPPLEAFQNNGQRPKSQSGRFNKRCRSYDEQGYCERGAHCPYIHDSGGKDSAMSEEYDPNQAQLLGLDDENATSPHFNRASTMHRGGPSRGGARSRGNMSSHRGNRSAISELGPNYDKDNTSIVVENIPENQFTEEAVRSFFSDFGSISNVNMQPYKRIVVITYDEYDAARAAYESPKVIFDNRFVKVFWQKPGSDPSAPSTTQNGRFNKPQAFQNNSQQKSQQSGDDGEMLDPDEFAKRQEEAQRAHEEKTKRLQEAATAKEELDARVKAQAEERRKLMEKLAAKTGGAVASKSPKAAAGPLETEEDNALGSTAFDGTGSPMTTEPTTAKEPTQTHALRAKLAALEAEAATFGIPSARSPTQSSPPPGSAGRYGHHNYPFPTYRGRGRAGYNASFRARGGWRGGYAAGSAVARLDNRPKSVVVTAADESVNFEGEGSKGEEALRSFLFGIGDFSSIDAPSSISNEAKDPKTTRVVVFNERYIAENFIAAAKQDIPGLGKVSLSWLPAPSASSPTVQSAPVTQPAHVGATESNSGGALNGGIGAEGPETTKKVGNDRSEALTGNGANGGTGTTKNATKTPGAVRENDRDKDWDVADDDESAWL